jgi:hypothetical protein
MKVGDKHEWVLLNDVIYFQDLDIMQAPIFTGAGCDHKELGQTHNGFYWSYMYTNYLIAVFLFYAQHI